VKGYFIFSSVLCSLKFVNKQLPLATKQTKQGIKMGQKWKRVADKLTEDREAENRIIYFLEFRVLFFYSSLFYLNSQ
jgi:hypothetical protein